MSLVKSKSMLYISIFPCAILFILISDGVQEEGVLKQVRNAKIEAFIVICGLNLALSFFVYNPVSALL